MLFAVIVGAGLAHFLGDDGFRDKARQELSGSAAVFLRTLGEHFFLNPWFYGVFALVLALERLIPAQQSQSLASRGLRNDVWWVPVKLLAHASILPLYVLILGTFYGRYLSFLTVDSVAAWPEPTRLVLGILLGDFLFWATHYVRHKVRVLWYFHAVHHSQRELNFFTEYRVHPVDDLFMWTVGFIPLLMFSHSFATIVAIVWIRHWHTRLYHSNIRSNFGLLRYVLVTPQSHRVHHSIEPAHADRNFGLTFSLWDHLFGTQYRGYDEYPATGIDDGALVPEQESFRLSGSSNVIEQLLYPFRAIARDH